MSEDLRNKIIEQERASSQQHDKKIKENKNNIRKSKQAITQFCKDSEMICPMNRDG